MSAHVLWRMHARNDLYNRDRTEGFAFVQENVGAMSLQQRITQPSCNSDTQQGGAAAQAQIYTPEPAVGALCTRQHA